MTLLALFIALLLERTVTHSLRLREPRWFDGYLDWALRRVRNVSGGSLMLLTCLVVLLPVLPVALVAYVIRDLPLGIAFVAFATIVLVFSLGPRDLKDEVDDYLAALERGDREAAERVAREITEHDAAQRTTTDVVTLEEAIFVQTNNRIFGVVFWFMLVGPAGAWAFRVSDLLRRRAVFEHGRAGGTAAAPEFVRALQTIHGVVAWAPARLLALGYALAGNFERATSEWRRHIRETSSHFFETNDHLLASVGRAALADEGALTAPALEASQVRACLRLVTRALVIWLVFVAALVLIGWVR